MVGGTSFHCGILQASVGRMSTNNSKNNCNPKTFHERKSQNLSLVHVSLDNTDSVIEGGPPFSSLKESPICHLAELTGIEPVPADRQSAILPIDHSSGSLPWIRTTIAAFRAQHPAG